MRARRMMIPAAVLAGSLALLAPTAANAQTESDADVSFSLELLGSGAAQADQDAGPEITFADAFNTFIEGGGHLGRGAAELVAGAYTGIATTPQLIIDSLTD
jgi:hypothetical protein